MNETRVESVKIEIETREVNGKQRPSIRGLAVPYNKRSAPIAGMFREEFKPGAFTAHLAGNPDVRAFAHHDSKRVLGRTSAGTLRLREDSAGVHFEIDLPDTTDGNDMVESIRRGDISGMSFGFRTVTDKWRMDGGEELREVFAAELVEVSPVTFPAYGDTTVAVRSLEEFRRANQQIDLAEMEMRIRIRGKLP